MDPVKHFKAIEYESIIDIQVNGYFYLQVQAVLFYLINQIEHEELVKIMNAIKTRNFDEKENLHPSAPYIDTVFILMLEIEKQAKIQGKIVEKDIPEPPLD
jgi:proline racemase